MNETPSDQARLLDEAIDLIIRFQGDPDNPVSDELIRAWRGRSPLHEQIWTRVSRVHGASGKILNEQRRLERRDSLGLTRRKLLVGGVSVLGIGTAGYAFGPGMILDARADHRTGKGEIRRIPLPDGSIATLGPDSAIALHFQEAFRQVSLLSGMAFFEVAEDTARPFAVSCGTVSARAVGTAFDVSNDAGLVTVAVDRGSVDVSASQALLSDNVALDQGQWVAVDTSTGRVDRGERESGQIGSWRDKLIIADDLTVAALVARIGRWLPGRIIFADPTVANLRVSGIFDLTDPMRTLEAVVHPTGAHVRKVASLITVISPL